MSERSFLAKSGFSVGDGVISGVIGSTLVVVVGIGGAGLIAYTMMVSMFWW
jgi:hypothetical protein